MATKSRPPIDMNTLTHQGRWTPTRPYAQARPTEVRRLERVVHGRRMQLEIHWFKDRIDLINVRYYLNFTYDDIQFLRQQDLPMSLSDLQNGIPSIELFRTQSAAMADLILDMLFDPQHAPIHSTPGAQIPDGDPITAGTVIQIPDYPKKSPAYYQILAAPTWVSKKSYLYDLTVERLSSAHPHIFTALYMIASDTHGYLTPSSGEHSTEYVTDLLHILSTRSDHTRLCALLRPCLIPALSYTQLMNIPATLAPMVRDALEHRG